MSTTTCFYLTISYYLYWPSPANIYLSPDPFAQIASAEIIQQTRMPNNLHRLLLEDPYRQRISSIWFVFWNPCFWATAPPQNVKKRHVFWAEKVWENGPLQVAHPFPGRTPLRLHLALWTLIVQNLGIGKKNWIFLLLDLLAIATRNINIYI